MDTRIATYIETQKFYEIVESLKKSSWKLKAEYNELFFDKGIDFDFYYFVKDAETITMAWNNWMEGEIKTSTERLNEFAIQFDFNLVFGTPEYLHDPNFIENILKDKV